MTIYTNRRMNNTLFLKSIFIMMLFTNITCYAIDIKTSVDRNPVNLEESFQIIFTAEQTPDGDPDFSPLHTDFEILNQSQSTQSSWVNGKSSKTIQWILSVMAKQPGPLTIPKISFGNYSSQAANVLINQVSTALSIDHAAGDLFLQVSATPTTPYVQSQVIYTLKLFRKVNLAQARLTEPEMENAVIEKLGDDKTYTTQIQSVDYIVTERQYAIFPQQSGIQTIAPISLTAAVIVANNRSRFNGFFNQQSTRTKRIVSEAVTLHVQAKPDIFNNQFWLPAEQVYIEQKWSADTNQITVGEPITRTVTLLAKGTTVSQLPEINSSTINLPAESNEHLKQYPDQPVLKEQKNADSIMAFREEKIAYMLAKGGTYELPSIEVPWWNVKTQSMEKATLPAVTLRAKALDISSQINTQAEIQNQQTSPTPTMSVPIHHKIWIGLAAFLAAGWLLTLLFFLYKRKPKIPEQQPSQQQPTIAKSIKAVHRACKENDAKAAKDALILWGQQLFKVSSLGRIADFCEVPLSKEILVLNQLLYSEQNMQWDGVQLLQSFKNFTHKKQAVKTEENALEPLFKL